MHPPLTPPIEGGEYEGYYLKLPWTEDTASSTAILPLCQLTVVQEFSIFYNVFVSNKIAIIDRALASLSVLYEGKYACH